MGGLGHKLDIPKRLMYVCHRASDCHVCITILDGRRLFKDLKPATYRRYFWFIFIMVSNDRIHVDVNMEISGLAIRYDMGYLILKIITDRPSVFSDLTIFYDITMFPLKQA